MRFPDVPLSRLFAPRSIAIVGASTDRAKAGHQMMRSLAGFPGPLYAVNRGGAAVLGRPGFGRLQDIPEPPDLAVLVLPPEATVQVLEDCGAAGVRAAVLCSGGFAESGPEGAELQRQAIDIAERHRIWLLGPNTSGFANPPRQVFASFVPAIGKIRAGKLAVVAQSGGVNHALGFLGSNDRLGFSHLIGLGNSANLDFADVLEYLAQDESTAAVALHIEAVRDGATLMRAISELAAHKPVVACKVGRADVQAFVRSHTGALMGDQRLAEAALRQAGAVLARDTTEAVDALKALSTRRLLPRPPQRERGLAVSGRGPTGVAVVTGQAGPGIIIADVLRAQGVAVPPLSESTRARLAELLPPITFTSNPVDTGRPGATYGQVLRTVAADPSIGVVVIYQLLEPAADLRAVLAEFARDCGKPIILASGGPSADLEPLFGYLEQAGVACYPAPERAARAAIALVRDAAPRYGTTTKVEPSSAARDAAAVAANLAVLARREGRQTLYEDEAKQLLAVLGFVAPAGAHMATHAGARSMAASLGYPVVAKLLAPNLSHKSEAGAVKLNLAGEAALVAALEQLDQTAARLSVPPAYLIERFLPGPAELIVGARHDPGFGPTVLVGAGGVVAELVQDVSLRPAPLTEAQALDMLEELRSAKLLTGYRSPQAFDHRHAVAKLVAALSELISTSPDIVEAEVNPLILRPDGIFAADALVVLRELP